MWKGLERLFNEVPSAISRRSSEAFPICIIFSLFLTHSAQHLHLLARSKEMNAAVHTCTLCCSGAAIAAIDKKENRDFHNNNDGHRLANCAFATCMLIAVKEGIR